MEIIVGGYCQGKLNYVLQKTGLSREEVFDGEFGKLAEIQTYRILNKTHLLIKRLLSAGKGEEQILLFFSQLRVKHPNIIIICNEVGNGIVPLSQTERVWRETVGKIMCSLVKEADHMERICCGLSQCLK